jgi:hypothetical protein
VIGQGRQAQLPAPASVWIYGRNENVWVDLLYVGGGTCRRATCKRATTCAEGRRVGGLPTTAQHPLHPYFRRLGTAPRGYRMVPVGWIGAAKKETSRKQTTTTHGSCASAVQCKCAAAPSWSIAPSARQPAQRYQHKLVWPNEERNVNDVERRERESERTTGNQNLTHPTAKHQARQ